VEILAESTHTTADERRLLVLHGDEFDGVALYARWLAFYDEAKTAGGFHVPKPGGKIEG
jgi:UDP-2,3-diacylglucosamine pyrophosphatase LpxH